MLEYWLWLSGRRGSACAGCARFLSSSARRRRSIAPRTRNIRPISGRTAVPHSRDKELAPARQILQQCYRQCIHIVTLQDAVYPQRLKNIDDAPLVLYYQGVLPDFDAEPVIAMVGTRRASAYGLLQAKRIGYELGRYGAIVVSGGAAGIDTLALRGAVSSGTPPVAVFACGVDVDYPAANRSLFEDLRTNGCVMSELPPGTPPLPEHFRPQPHPERPCPRFRRGRGTEKERRAHHRPPRARAGKGRIHPPRQPRQSHLRGQHPAAQAGARSSWKRAGISCRNIPISIRSCRSGSGPPGP